MFFLFQSTTIGGGGLSLRRYRKNPDTNKIKGTIGMAAYQTLMDKKIAINLAKGMKKTTFKTKVPNMKNMVKMKTMYKFEAGCIFNFTTTFCFLFSCYFLRIIFKTSFSHRGHDAHVESRLQFQFYDIFGWSLLLFPA